MQRFRASDSEIDWLQEQKITYTFFQTLSVKKFVMHKLISILKKWYLRLNARDWLKLGWYFCEAHRQFVL